MLKLYIDYEWGVEIPLLKEDGTYFTKKDLENCNLDVALFKSILLWSFAVQNEFNWHNPSDDKKYLPDFYYKFIIDLENYLIEEFKKNNILIIKNK